MATTTKRRPPRGRPLTRGAAALHLYLAATRGTAAALARRLDVTEMAVSLWHRGGRVPSLAMREALAAETRGAVSVEAWDRLDGVGEMLAAAHAAALAAAIGEPPVEGAA